MTKPDLAPPPRITIYLNRGTGFYHANVYFSDGTRIRPSLGVQKEIEVEHALALFRETRLPGIVAKHSAAADPPPGRADTSGDPRIRDLVDHYVDRVLPSKNAACGTITLASRILYEFQRFCAGRNIGRASQLTPATVDAWAADSRVRDSHSPKTTRNRLMMLRACLNAAVDRELMLASPIRKWLLPKCEEPEIWPLTEEQLARVLDIVRDRAPAIVNCITWIALTGQRPSDATALKWRQVNRKARIVERTQQKARRLAVFEISGAAAAVLDMERGRKVPGETVFTGPAGLPLTNNILYNGLIRALTAAGFERRCNVKDLRHTFCSLAVNEWGIPLPQVQVLAGHSDIRMTMRYVHPGSSRDKLDAAQAKFT